MTPTQPVVTRTDIEELKTMWHETNATVRELRDSSIRNEAVAPLVAELNRTVNGDGNGNLGLNSRVDSMEKWKKSINSVLIALLTAVLIIVVVGAFYMAFGHKP